MTPLEEFLLETIQDAVIPLGPGTLTIEVRCLFWMPRIAKEMSPVRGQEVVDDALNSLMSQNLIQLKDGLWEAVNE